MRLKKDTPATTCGACGQTIPVPPMGTLLYNPYRNVLGVVVAPIGTAVDAALKLVTVTVITGSQAGQRMNWYMTNVDRVSGHFHIASRTKVQ